MQYYIFAPTMSVGVADALIERARAGVKVSFLFDPIGSSLPRSFIEELRDVGIRCSPFDTTRGKGNRFQVNFRNHRKIVVVDGRVAFVGGLNVGDDYLGLDPEVGRWRDAHVRVQGPAAVMAAVAFVKDWYWARRKLPRMDFELPQPAELRGPSVAHRTGRRSAGMHGLAAVVVQCGAQAHLDRESLFRADRPRPAGLATGNPAWRRGSRGGAGEGDNRLIRKASLLYQAELLRAGEGVPFSNGFPSHQGLRRGRPAGLRWYVNLDHRSILINFEIAVFSDDAGFVGSVAAMLEDDFAESREMSLAEVNRRSIWHRFVTRAANMLAPIL